MNTRIQKNKLVVLSDKKNLGGIHGRFLSFETYQKFKMAAKLQNSKKQNGGPVKHRNPKSARFPSTKKKS
jgi:hypothetical protein